MKFPEEDAPSEKKQVDYLYLEADEDHISLQFQEKKGDLLEVSEGRKNNCMISKLVYVHEGIQSEAEGSKRMKLVYPHYFCGTAYQESNPEFWDRIYRYLDEHYDLQKVKKIYINSDGGEWIKSGMRRIHGLTFVLHEFHLRKYIVKLTSHMKDSSDDARNELYQAYSKMTGAICKIYEDVIGIAADHIFVKYHAVTNWGWNGTNF